MSALRRSSQKLATRASFLRKAWRKTTLNLDEPWNETFLSIFTLMLHIYIYNTYFETNNYRTSDIIVENGSQCRMKEFCAVRSKTLGQKDTKNIHEFCWFSNAAAASAETWRGQPRVVSTLGKRFMVFLWFMIFPALKFLQHHGYH